MEFSGNWCSVREAALVEWFLKQGQPSFMLAAHRRKAMRNKFAANHLRSNLDFRSITPKKDLGTTVEVRKAA